jgi:hypothetical protein
VAALVTYVVAGVVLLPMVFRASTAQIDDADWAARGWLAAALILAGCGSIVLSRLADPLALALAPRLVRLGEHVGPSITPSEALFLQRVGIVVVQVLVAQAVLRRPVALVLGGQREAASLEAGIAAVALALVLVALAWAYVTGRPMLYSAVLRLLDSALPTVGSDAAISEPDVTAQPTLRSAATVARVAEEPATVVAPSSAHDAPTLPSSRS